MDNLQTYIRPFVVCYGSAIREWVAANRLPCWFQVYAWGHASFPRIRRLGPDGDEKRMNVRMSPFLARRAARTCVCHISFSFQGFTICALAEEPPKKREVKRERGV